MAKVTLRKMKLKDGNYSLFLDITGHGQPRQKKYLKFKVWAKPRNQEQRTENANNLNLARDVAARVQLDLREKDYFNQRTDRHNADFLRYFDYFIANYDALGKSTKNLRAARDNFITFLAIRGIRDGIKGKDITNVLCEDYAQYLASQFKGETPSSYFRKFRQVLRKAFKENIVKVVSSDLETKCLKFDKYAITKPLLSIDEIEALYQSNCPNTEVKRAFIFSLNTGLDFASVKNLTWDKIHGHQLNFKRGKTDKQNLLPLNEKALLALSERGKPHEIIFKLPTYQACTKNLKAWAKSAGVKNFTWHSARHSLAVNLINEYGVDVATIQEILGHSEIKTTMRYAKVNMQSKANALNKLNKK